MSEEIGRQQVTETPPRCLSLWSPRAPRTFRPFVTGWFARDRSDRRNVTLLALAPTDISIGTIGVQRPFIHDEAVAYLEVES